MAFDSFRSLFQSQSDVTGALILMPPCCVAWPADAANIVSNSAESSMSMIAGLTGLEKLWPDSL